MTELELTRTPDDRRLYALPGVGTLRLEGLLARTATATADDRRWRFGGRGRWRRGAQATDAAGAVVGEFEPHRLRRGGTLRWAGEDFLIQPASRFRERYALRAGERELVVLDGRGWGRRPVRVRLESSEPVEPGLLLFAAYVVRGLAKAAGEGSTAATAGAGS
jgi:hypothetical protein